MRQFSKTFFALFMLLGINQLKAATVFSKTNFFQEENRETGFDFCRFGKKEVSHFNPKLSFMLPSAGDDEYGAGMNAGFISLALPGVGLYKANRSRISLAFLPICYGLVGGGTFQMMKGKSDAREAYANYMVEKNPLLQDEYLEAADKAKEKNQIGATCLSAGIAVWLGQTVWTFIYGRYNDMYRARDAKWNNKVSFLPFGGYDFRTNTTTLNLSIKF